MRAEGLAATSSFPPLLPPPSRPLRTAPRRGGLLSRISALAVSSTVLYALVASSRGHGDGPGRRRLSFGVGGGLAGPTSLSTRTRDAPWPHHQPASAAATALRWSVPTASGSTGRRGRARLGLNRLPRFEKEACDARGGMAEVVDDEPIRRNKTLDLDKCVEAAGFSFEVYTDPEEGDGVWERDADGNDIAYLSPKYVRDTFAGLLEVRVLRASGLPMVSNPYIKLTSGSTVAQTKTTGLGFGKEKFWGSDKPPEGPRGGEPGGLGEVFYFYVPEKGRHSVGLDVWTSSLTGLFTKRLGAAQLALRDGLCDGGLHDLALPIAGDGYGPGAASVSVRVRWHDWSEAEEIAGVPLRIHDVSASGLQGMPVRLFAGPGGGPRDVRGMDTGELVALLRAWGLRTTGSREDLQDRARIAARIRRDDAVALLKSVRGLIGRNNTLLMSRAVQDAASMFDTGMGMLKGDTFGALQGAVLAASKEIIGKPSFDPEEILRGDFLRNVRDGDYSGLASGFQSRLMSARDKAQKTALAKIAGGMGLTSRQDGSAWRMLLEAANHGLNRTRAEYELCAFIENDDTDTQAYVYRSFKSRTIWVAFRGTEQTKWKDIVTDMMIIPSQPEFAREPTEGALRISDLEARGLDPGGRYAVKLVYERVTAPYLTGAQTSIVESERDMLSGASVSKFRDILELDDIKAGDLVRISLVKCTEDGEGADVEEEVGGLQLLAESSVDNNAMWYPIAAEGPAQLRARLSFSEAEGSRTKPQLGEPSQQGNGIDDRLDGSDVQNKSNRGGEEAKPEPDRKVPPSVHMGFLQAYNSIRKRMLETVENTLRLQPDEKWDIYVTGHSLGGALATLAAYELAIIYKRRKEREKEEREVNHNMDFLAPEVKVHTYTFGSPRVGNAAFAEDFDHAVPDSWRVYNSKDVIPTVPRMMQYSHVKTGVLIDSEQDVIKLGAASRQDQQCAGDEADYVELTAQNIHKLTPEQMFPSLSRIMDSELERLKLLTDGSAISEHMEDLYFLTLQKVILKEMTEDM